MEETTDYSYNKLHNLDKNIIVDTLKHNGPTTIKNMVCWIL